MSRLRPASIRARLALGYGLAVGLALVAYAVVVYAFFRGSLFEQLDDRLHDDYEAVEHAFERAPDGTLRWLATTRDPDASSPEAPWTEVSLQGRGVLLRRPVASDASEGPSRTRQWNHRLGTEEFTIRVGRSEVVVRRELRELLGIFALGLLPAVVLASLGGLVLARRALAPVGEMARRARTITAERLSERLPVVDPSDELGALATVFNETFSRLERSFDQLRRFTADASHELRTPLTALRSVGEVALRDRRDETAYREAIGSMLEEADRLTSLVEGLLALSRSDAGRTRVRRVPTDVGALAREVASRLSVLAEERGQTLSVDGSGPVVRDVDPMLLRQALTNLVDNAIKHGPERSVVRIEVSESGPDAAVAVTDAGDGIPPEHREHVFERFYRVDAARSRGGTGLGLAIAKAAVEAQGGRIELATAGPPGCTFRIVLPT